MLATSQNVLFPCHNHLLTTGTDDLSLAGTWAIIKVSGHQYRWLAGCYDLEIGQFLEVASMVVTWWILTFCIVEGRALNSAVSPVVVCGIFLNHLRT